ncbi:hypothetical protein [Paenibacillus ginsengihumi]|uniref:hypothetical protein n=1 Tax=Paenibacillus ginsengihumi TaxID=431596 RepID=UPI00037B6160|nr:hypothetical protein [Paenibacillus ginsengihumi]
MFDPTIFDNLKVVLEGSCYDLDREGEAVVTGREDVLDLASLGRTFVMRLALPGGRCEAEWSLQSGLADFAMELAGLRRAADRPGAVLRLRLTMPPAWARQADQADAILRRVWGEESELRHEYRLAFDPQAGASLDEAAGSAYAVDVRFGGKIDESELEALDGMLRKSVLCLSQLEELEQPG